MASSAGYLAIIGLQVLITAACAAVFGVLRGSNAALSCVLGGLVCIVPSAIFALRLWIAAMGANRLGAGPEAALTFGVKVAFGELLKVMLMVAGFVLVFKFHPGLDAIAFFVGLIAAVHSYLFGLLVAR
ncbi:MAG: ATP synthase subunit I [Burkholderiales bacterium]